MRAGRTAYSRIAEALRGEILAGSYDGGGQLPTESELCRRFHTSRITVRQALRILEEERLVRRRQGVGTFANAGCVRKIPILNADFFGSVARHAPDLKRRLLARDRLPAEADVADRLHIRAGEVVLRAVRVDVLRSAPVATDETWFCEPYGSRLTDGDLTALDMLACCRRRGIDVAYASQVIEAVAARAPVTRRLGVRRGQALLKESNVLYAPGHQPRALFVSHYRPEWFHFEATVTLGGKLRPRGQS